ncbi:MAG: hypothetical protein MZU84_06335 [Sphingobacterium sp.]|nr:hypothetical protein [Sphingobacterium sp.]
MMFTLQTPPGRLLNTMLTGEAGGYFDGWRVSLGVTPTWSGIPDLEIGGMFQYNLVRFPARDQSYRRPDRPAPRRWPRSASSSRSAPSSSTTAPTTRAGANVRFRYNPREGTDFYLVYNEGIYTDRSDRIPTRRPRAAAPSTPKFNYTVQLLNRGHNISFPN